MDTKCCEAPGCVVEFVPKRSTAKFCSATCRQRAGRDRKAATESVEADAKAGKAEHSLIRAVRKELAAHDALDTVDGQLALQIARRIVDPDGAGASTLSRELRALMTAAKSLGTPPPSAAPAAPAEDEVEIARRKREEARQKAGLA